MTVIAAAFPRARPARWTLAETLAFAGAVFLLLTYSQGWELPMAGGGKMIILPTAVCCASPG